MGFVAFLWFELFRLVTFSLIGAAVVAHAAGSRKSRSALSISQGLVNASPIYIYALISTLWSPDREQALRDAVYIWIAVAPAIALGVTLVRRYTFLQIAEGLAFLLLPFALQAAVGAAQGNDPMLVGNLTMRSLLGSAICLISPILAGAWALTRRPRFLVFGLIAGVFAVTMESRTVILFAMPAALLSVYLQDRKLAKQIVWRWTLPIIIASLLANPAMLARFGSEGTNLNFGDSVIDELALPSEDRTDFDRRLTTFTATAAFLEHPLFGHGYSSVFQTNQNEYGLEISAHGLIPGTLGELGLVGMAVLAYTLWRAHSAAKAALRLPRAVDPMLIHFIVGFWALILVGLFHQTIESVFFGLILGLLMGTRPRKHLRAALQSGGAQPHQQTSAP